MGRTSEFRCHALLKRFRKEHDAMLGLFILVIAHTYISLTILGLYITDAHSVKSLFSFLVRCY